MTQNYHRPADDRYRPAGLVPIADRAEMDCLIFLPGYR
jgi:hypothetical protein